MFSMICDCGLLGWVFGLYIVYKVLDYLYRMPKVGGLKDRYIFISGCDTGFGYETAVKLDGMGCNVFAGCLTEKGESELRKRCSSRLKTLPLDVSKHESVLKAAEFVGKNLPQGKGLHGVVNNAGIAGWHAGPVEWLRIEDYEAVNSVNLYGLIDVTVTLMPYVKRARGRYVNTASVFGRFSLLGAAPYSVSKYGVEAFTDSLRREMRLWKCSAHLIEPGLHKTNITASSNLTKSFEAAWNRISPEMQADYGEEFRRKNIEDVINKRISDLCSERVHDVVDGYIHALLARHPRGRYVIGKDAKFFWLLIGALPEWLGDKILYILAGKDRPIPAAAQRLRQS